MHAWILLQLAAGGISETRVKKIVLLPASPMNRRAASGLDITLGAKPCSYPGASVPD
jgi:hypothetical protein